jgi:uncharacterized protein YndB with AHSA1/START domain
LETERREASVTRDAIERELVLPAPPEKVWEALTDPAQVSRWFGVEAEIDLRPGGPIVFGWPEHGRFHGVVDEVVLASVFSYRWCLDRDTPVDAGPTTKVRFTLEAAPEGTRLRLVESGFASLPDGVRDRHLVDNTQGWEEELGELSRYLGVATVGG